MSILERFRPVKERPAPFPESGYAAVEAEAVSVELGHRKVLDDVSLQVRSGEVLALVGPNGAGKSTLLAALSGDLPVSGGGIRFHERPIDAWTHDELALRRAVLLQQIQLTFPFTVRDVVEMGRAPWAGISGPEEDEKAIADALAATDVTRFAGRYFNSLSGGEKARVALARILAQDTKTIYLDEPTAALDIKHQEQVLSIARDRAETGSAIVVVLHDLNLAAGYADRTAVLSDGGVAAIGQTATVLTAELLSSVYQHRIEVIQHPVRGTPVVLPHRDGSLSDAGHTGHPASL